MLLNPASGIVRVDMAASKDRPGQGAIAFYVEPAAVPVQIPASIAGIATVVIPANGISTNFVAGQLRAASFNQALAVKQRNAANLMKSNPAIFGIGVGRSLDNPADAALILFVDRQKATGKLPESLEGQRVRLVLMDRLHVTRAHGSPAQGTGSCPSFHSQNSQIEDEIRMPNFENRLKLPD